MHKESLLRLLKFIDDHIAVAGNICKNFLCQNDPIRLCQRLSGLYLMVYFKRKDGIDTKAPTMPNLDRYTILIWKLVNIKARLRPVALWTFLGFQCIKICLLSIFRYSECTRGVVVSVEFLTEMTSRYHSCKIPNDYQINGLVELLLSCRP